ncbi:RrF2 family transcriptional regulator [Limnoglobus roseus]|uniref:Rrf2 family transcriptional regulator n=1 Tax=Limnoglobus roseus TaxID=2598579 RepID=A0A5C1AFA1_9BACT|nr:Rrf2 family transcriptional regulator [Limnoglobus roseus]QEL15814.1 Rrf2 family transcriptional regulator [Limnoglobus roseus]
MQFSAKAEYACLAMLELAVRFGDPRPVRLVDITETHGIPQRFLVQILLQLKGAGLVSSTRGAAGGYHLARSPEQITLANILDVIDRAEPSTNGNRPTGRTDGSASQLAVALRDVWAKIMQSRQEILENTTLAALAQAGQGLQYVI